MRAASSALSRLPSLASRSSTLRQNTSRSATVGGTHDRAEPGDVVLADLAGDAVGIDEADLQAVPGLAEAGEHGVVARSRRQLRGASRSAPLRASRAVLGILSRPHAALAPDRPPRWPPGRRGAPRGSLTQAVAQPAGCQVAGWASDAPRTAVGAIPGAVSVLKRLPFSKGGGPRSYFSTEI
jgi:hypothetical protein